MLDDNLKKLPWVMEKTSLSRNSIYTMMSKGDFPRAIKVGNRAIAWKQDEIEKWIESRPRVEYKTEKSDDQDFN